MSDTNKAPWHLWVVGILALLWNGFGAFDFTASALRFEAYLAAIPQAMLDHIYAQPVWLWAVWAIGTWGGVIGAILLLLRNKLAVLALALSFIGASASQAPSIIEPPMDIGAPPFLPWIIIAISVALLAYAFWLSRRGVLR
ncbi:MAG: hypothetical protein H7124_06690 [Phycisphaerales bacterium]|nr:hypothetical protein [Hyphomonadaceae bacterium]